MKLQSGVNTGNGKKIYYIQDPATKVIKDKLGRGGLGFRYWRGMWYIDSDRMNDRILTGLSNLNIDTSVISPKVEHPKPFVDQVSDGISEQEDKVTEQSEIPELTNKVDSMEGQNDGKTYDKVPGERYYGFKPNRNIYSTELTLNIDGREFPCKIVMDRWYKKGRRKVPSYRYTLFDLNETMITTLATIAPGEWGTYNEDKIAFELEKTLNELLSHGEKSRTYRTLKMYIELEDRPEEIKKFLKEWADIGSWREKENYDFISKYISLPAIEINGEDLPILPVLSGDETTVALKTYVNHPLKPSDKALGYIYIPNTLQTKEQIFEFINNEIINNYEKYSEEYKKYLSTFPYEKDAEEKSRAFMGEIAEKIKNRGFSIGEIKEQLINYGYVRASKRQKSDIGGMQIDQKWVIESKKAVDAAYGRINSPEKFYGVVAYWLHRKVRNISSWTDMMLGEAIRSFHRLLKRYGYEITIDDLYKYLNTLVDGVYREFFGKEPGKSRQEQFDDFYNGERGGGGSSGQKNNFVGGMDSWVNFVVGLGINAEVARSNPKMVYRQLSRKYHPDVNEEEASKGGEVFKQLNNLYNSLPDEIKRAGNWYSRVKVGSK